MLIGDPGKVCIGRRPARRLAPRVAEGVALCMALASARPARGGGANRGMGAGGVAYPVAIHRTFRADILPSGADSGARVRFSAGPLLGLRGRLHSEYAARFAQDDLFAADFPRACVNRLQLAGGEQMPDSTGPAASR